MFNDVIISVDGPINGYVVVFDMQGVCLRHLTRVQFGPLRNFMAYIQVLFLVTGRSLWILIRSLQEAHPVRLKKIYIVHTAWFVNQAFAIVKPFIKTELMSLLHFTTGGPDEIFSEDVLPEVDKSAHKCTKEKLQEHSVFLFLSLRPKRNTAAS